MLVRSLPPSPQPRTGGRACLATREAISRAIIGASSINDAYMSMSEQDERKVPNGLPICNGGEEHQDADDEETYDKLRHQRFLSALENIPQDSPESNWIIRMAGILHWDPGEVESYAYRYFVALNEYDQEQRSEEVESYGEIAPWSQEESVLFDSLLVVYGDDDRNVRDEQRWAWVTHMAEFFPRRTPTEIWDRWNRLRQESEGNGKDCNGGNGYKGRS
jgi:hypothetical protein